MRNELKACRCGGNARAEGLSGALKAESFEGRDWKGGAFPEFRAELGAFPEWCATGRLKAFDEGGRTVHDTVEGRRRRLGAAAWACPRKRPHPHSQVTRNLFFG